MLIFSQFGQRFKDCSDNADDVCNQSMQLTKKKKDDKKRANGKKKAGSKKKADATKMMVGDDCSESEKSYNGLLSESEPG